MDENHENKAQGLLHVIGFFVGIPVVPCILLMSLVAIVFTHLELFLVGLVEYCKRRR